MKLADDVASLNPNIGSLNYDVDLNDTENCLHSEKIQSMPEEKGFAKYSADGKFDVAQTYGESLADSGVNQWSRYVQGRDYFGSQLTEGTDYDIITVKEKGKPDQKGAMVSEIQPLFFKPGKSGWSTFELIRAFGNRGENVPASTRTLMVFIASAASATPRSTSSRFVAGMTPKSLPSSGKCSPAPRTPSPSRCTPL